MTTRNYGSHTDDELRRAADCSPLDLDAMLEVIKRFVAQEAVIDEEIEERDSEIEELKAEIAGLENDVSELEYEVTELETERDALQDTVNELQAEAT